MKRIDVLNLEFTSYPSRDRQTATLVCNYLRHMGYQVYEGSVHQGFQLINKLKPRLFYITNTIGAKVNVNLVKYAKKRGRRVISGTSEGNMQESFIKQFFWGNNNEHIMYEDLSLQWTNRTRDLSIKYYPETKEKIKVSGAAGFDIFKISSFISKEKFLQKHNKSEYKKCIGFGCWDFGFLYPNDTRFGITKERWSKKERQRFKQDGQALNSILISIIQNNPSILFILKEHPGNQMGAEASAIIGAEDFDNVLILKKEPIIDCISASDFWLTYESTTVIEAWLLNKQTGLINPSGIDFPRANVHLGSPNYKNSVFVQDAIDSFYKSNKLLGFEELEIERQKVITNVIQWDDGLNHVRIGNEIIELLKQAGSKLKPQPFLFLKERLIQRVAFLFKKRFNNEYKHQVQFDKKELKEFAETRLNEQIDYYNKLGLTKEKLLQIRCI